MLTLSRPHSIDASMEQSYRYLLDIFEPIVGFPLQLRRGPPAPAEIKIKPRRHDDGTIHYPLPSARARKTHWYIVVGADAATDSLCRQMVPRFVARCKKFCASIKQSSDIKAELIRTQSFFWDDLVLSLSYSGGQKYNAHELLSAMRESLLFRYEDKPVKIGVLMTWNWHSLAAQLKEAGGRRLKSARLDDFQEALRQSKALNWLSDGESSVLLVTPKCKTAGIVILPAAQATTESSLWSLVPVRYRRLHSLLSGRDALCVTSQAGDLYFLRKKSAFKWTHRGWRRASGAIVRKQLLKYVSEDVAAVLSDIAVELSFQRRGGLLAIVREAAALVGKVNGLRAMFQDDRLLQVTEKEFWPIFRLASLDGCTVIDTAGVIRNAGVIIDIPPNHIGTGEGARTAAASAISTHGMAVKISQDGPISVYEAGRLTLVA